MLALLTFSHSSPTIPQVLICDFSVCVCLFIRSPSLCVYVCVFLITSALFLYLSISLQLENIYIVHKMKWKIFHNTCHLN